MGYGWPLKPFDRPHPIRAHLNDPRIEGISRAFHFGVDIAAANGTPVYAVEPGVVHFNNPSAVAVAAGNDSFGYWHIVPAVRPRQRVDRHQLLGHVEEPWLHVHFAERRDGVYRNPLRPGAITPWEDTTAPRVTRLSFERNGSPVSAAALAGAVDVIVEAADSPPIAVPPPWNGLPLTPARIRWRVLQHEAIIRPWHTPIDFATRMLPQTLFDRVYAHGTRQNHAHSPGLYRLYLAHTWRTHLLPDGAYRVEVEASDLGGNAGQLQRHFTIANRI